MLLIERGVRSPMAGTYFERAARSQKGSFHNMRFPVVWVWFVSTGDLASCMTTIVGGMFCCLFFFFDSICFILSAQ